MLRTKKIKHANNWLCAASKLGNLETWIEVAVKWTPPKSVSVQVQVPLEHVPDSIRVIGTRVLADGRLKVSRT